MIQAKTTKYLNLLLDCGRLQIFMNRGMPYICSCCHTVLTEWETKELKKRLGQIFSRKKFPPFLRYESKIDCEEHPEACNGYGAVGLFSVEWENYDSIPLVLEVTGKPGLPYRHKGLFFKRYEAKILYKFLQESEL